ncbi:RHS repeat domain-containing protein [Iodobacter fluviatilis]|uniref:Teneurin-like YD-shell domain-containing protein n=1 Tax=Iodobacter fluviatilis TaxID=537 RepID=A0A7G3GAF9_9NEIS|nr:RHS repeat-associated core domain-containing protein [Iodobacter fluviatilis]QBC44063.1 hypothetical protein C1H71_11335 [Iodobacter fluviatilis]
MHSNAFNGSTYLQGSVDLRTGQYGAQQSLITLRSVFNEDASRQVSLTFSMLQEVDSGFGLGWRLTGLSQYRDALMDSYPTIRLSTGETYNVEEASDGIVFKDKKGINVFARRETTDKVLLVYKSGVIETLTRIEGSSDALKLTRIQYENGEFFDITYQYLGPMHCPDKITDYQGTTLVHFESLYQDAIDIIHVRINANQYVDYDLSDRASNKLNSISLVSDDKSLRLTSAFEYDPRFLAITQLTNPLGGIERIVYQPEGHSVGGLSQNSYIPYVSTYERIPSGNQPPTKLSYEYSAGLNFTGYPFNGNHPSSTEDNLYLYDDAYDYSTTEMMLDQEDNVLHTHLVNYNRFHLVTSEINSEINAGVEHKVTKITTYNETKGNFYDQPENLQQAKKIETQYQLGSGTPRIEIQTITTDDYGNVTHSVDVNGIQTTDIYYAKGGEPGKCPADPFNYFVRFIKQSTQSAAANNGSPKVTTFEYTDQTISTTPFSYFVKQSSSNLNNGKFITESVYRNDPNSCFNGMLHQETESLPVGNGPDRKQNQTVYDYILSNDTLCITTTQIGFDLAQQSEVETTNLYTGLLLNATDSNDVTIAYEYDVFGRLTCMTEAAGSLYESKQTHQYTLPAGSALYTITVTNEWGVATQTKLDGFAKELLVESQDENGQFEKGKAYSGSYRVIKKTEYDCRGRLLVLSDFDYTGGIESSMLRSAYSYDGWGEISQIEHNDGVIETIENDPVALIKTEGKKDLKGTTLAYTRTTFNEFKQPAQVDILKKDKQTVYSTKKMAYDGFGRLIQQITPTLAISSINQYDDFDRPVSYTHFDGTEHAITYFDASTENMVCRIDAKIGKAWVTLGARTFDGVGRKLSQTVSNSTVQHTYQDGSEYPCSIINGRGNIITLDYIPELDHLGSLAVSTDDTPSTVVRSYDFTTKNDLTRPAGMKIAATHPEGSYSYDYNPTGRLTKIGHFGKGKGTTTAIEHKRFTLNGDRLQSSIWGSDQDQTIDRFGRVEISLENGIETSTTYDAFGRVSIISVKQNSALVQTTTVEYDEFEREVERTIAFGTQSTTIEQTYDILDRLKTRRRTLASGASMMERYDYDGRGRLINYLIDDGYDASLLPRDGKGHAITGQDFTYDGLNNITTVVTTYPNTDRDEATYIYTGLRLTTLTHSLTTGINANPASIAFSYDKDGNVTSIASATEQNTFTYTALNQIATINNVPYDYDAYGRLISSGDTSYNYQNDLLHQTKSLSDNCTIVRHAGSAMAEVTKAGTKFLGNDSHGSILRVKDGSTDTNISYTPFGVGQAPSRCGFNGEIQNHQSGGYLLGSGARLYLPEFAQFTSLDPLSPFSTGGLNPYRYCLGDPVSAIDPSGYSPQGDVALSALGIFVSILAFASAPFTGGTSIVIATAMLSAVLGVVSSSLKLAAGLTTNEQKAQELKKISLGFGIASAVVGIGGAIGGAAYSAVKSGSSITTLKTFKLTIGRTSKKSTNVLVPTRKMPGMSATSRNMNRYDSRQFTRMATNRREPNNFNSTFKLAPLFKNKPSYTYKKIAGPFLLKTENTRTNVKGVSSFFITKNLLTHATKNTSALLTLAISIISFVDLKPLPVEEDTVPPQSAFNTQAGVYQDE